MAVFERYGIRDAERAYWYEAGTLNGLLYNNAPTASYWAYKWYGDMAGNIVQTVPGSWLEGVASYDPTRRFGRPRRRAATTPCASPASARSARRSA
ncbi:hypothetical protein [Dactylosporangium darangshiense]